MVSTSINFVSTELDLVKKIYGEKLESFSSSLTQVAEQVQQKLKNANTDGTRLDYFKWLDFAYLKNLNQSQTRPQAAKFKAAGFKNALVVGMGGSGINSLVLKNSLVEFNPNKSADVDVWIQNNLDPSSMLARLKQLENDLDKTLFVIISK